MDGLFFKPPSDEQVDKRDTYSVCIDDPGILANHYAKASAHNADDAILITLFHFLLDYVRHCAGSATIHNVQIKKIDDGVFELNVGASLGGLSAVKVFIRDPENDDAECQLPNDVLEH